MIVTMPHKAVATMAIGFIFLALVMPRIPKTKPAGAKI